MGNEPVSVVHSDPEIMGGTPVFVGTRVPFQTLLDYLEAGDPLGEFLDDFPTVTREQAIAALEQARERPLRPCAFCLMSACRGADNLCEFQNEVHRFALAIVVLHAKTNKLGDLRPLVPELLARQRVGASTILWARVPEHGRGEHAKW